VEAAGVHMIVARPDGGSVPMSAGAELSGKADEEYRTHYAKICPDLRHTRLCPELGTFTEHDITDEAGIEAVLRTTIDEYGRADTLVHNAFTMPPMRDLSTVDLDQVRRSFETNVYAALRLTRLFTPALVATRGSVVMVNSAVLRHSRRTFGAYKMTKAGLLAVAQSLATELGPRGVRVNSIAPSYIWADKLQQYFGYLAHQRGVPPEQIYEETAAGTDLRRLTEPAEIADTVVFLASRLARAVTGQCLDVNAGEFHQ